MVMLCQSLIKMSLGNARIRRGGGDENTGMVSVQSVSSFLREDIARCS